MQQQINTGKSQTASLLGLHSWSGIVLGMLLYAVIFTGVIAVVADEIGEWSQSHAPQDLILSANIDAMLTELSAQTDPEYLDEISIFESFENHLVFFFHTHAQNTKGDMDDLGVEYRVNASGELLKTREGFGSDLFPSDDSNALSRFLVSIHTELHIPSPWGLILTGILGLAMLIAAVSGFMMHKNLFSDMFLIRTKRSGTRLKRDSHTVAGTWSIPFAFLLAFTGSFFSFAGAFGLPAMAMVAFGGDQEAMMYTLVGEQMNKSETPLPSTSVNAILADAAQRQGAVPVFVSVSHLNTESAGVNVIFMPSQGAVSTETLQYDASTGEFIQNKPFIGTEPSLGSLILSLIFPIHFGTFAGLFSKFVWVSLGIAACYVTITGMQLYANRNEKNVHGSWRWFTRMCHWGFYGLPVCSLASGYGFFLSYAAGKSMSSWTPTAFVVAAALVTVLSLSIKPVALLRKALLAISAAMCLGLPVLRILVSDVGWGSAIHHHLESVMLVDICLLLCAGVCLWLLRPAKEKVTDAAKNHQTLIKETA